MWQEALKKLEEDFFSELNNLENAQAIEELRIKYLGRKATLNQFFKELSSLSREEKATWGKHLNALKERFNLALNEKLEGLNPQVEEKIDTSFPGIPPGKGSVHLLNAVNERICRIFQNLGFVVIEGKEIEDEWHNFSALNIPLEHPSRDAFDTFYLELPAQRGRLLLRSHTSPSQIRVMEKLKPPLAVISPGRVYRPDKVDASHSFMFHQIEGFSVDVQINFAHLKGVLLYFAREFFGEDIQLRFRPHFFPFTEPSAEVDILCFLCKGKKRQALEPTKCSLCKGKGWLEILGCGMIHPHVLEACKINPQKYQGFAFGMGVERIAMLKYGIDDIRLFFENDLRFLEQF